MTDVQPFRSLRYNVERVGCLSSVISPPYDVVSPREQQLYLMHSPYNVIRLELGEEKPSDSSENNRYTRAAGTLRKWLEEGILFREQSPAIYIFKHRFIHQGVEKSRWGLNARVRVEDWSTGWVRPHEHTFEEKIGDRLKLMRSCCCNLSPIMGMFRHEPGGLISFLTRLTEDDPDLSALDLQGVTHNVWIINDEKSIAEISAWCGDKVIYIADGHHRYETALAYKREQIAAHSSVTGDEAFNFVMMTLMDAGDPGVIMFPTHRLVRLVEPQSLARLKEEFSPFFHLEELDPSGTTPAEALKVWLEVLEERGKKGIAIGLYGFNGKRFCILMPREGANLQEMMPPEHSQLWKDLDVAILHQIILRRIMGMDALQDEEYLKHTQEGMEAIDLVDSSEYQLAFLMNSVPVSTVLAVADTGDRMPQKFTYFYPKLPTGFAMYPLWDNE